MIFSRPLVFSTLSAALLACSMHSAVADLETATPEDVGMSSERLERLSELNQAYVDDGKLAGIATMVARRGKIVHVDVAGSYGLDNEQALTDDTLFRIFSMTKPVTSVALMMLYEEGAFKLKDPVSKFLPQFAELKVWTEDGQVPATTPMTMHHLLTHTSGLSYGFNPEDPVDELYRAAREQPSENLDDFIDIVATLPLVAEPGSRWHYSIATDVLGAVAEKISGQPFDEFLQARIFDPLEMNDTFFSVPADELDRLATNHTWDYTDNTMKVVPPGGPLNTYTDVTLFLGGQGLVSTLGDYMKFAEMMRNGGELNGARLLSPRTVQFMTQNHMDGIRNVGASGESPTTSLPTSNGSTGFGLGFGVLIDPIKSGTMTPRGTYQWGGAAGTIFWIDPVEDIVVVAMLQLMSSPWPLREELTILTYQALTELNESP